ncbi:MAG: ABC transporter permease [Candidatus Aminicenantes bacterium]|nr:ABC transporter permease [Candidatus Aminicenantes bacterium]NIM84829.1 ABC transporter permease [Candidatus Aminicenantes bacterium]NIN22822.1 ABC transporter permease [Candidatus Aminicenantes bacterium]NIN46558.1 ABC transporter permease [Candidatus Aminicenantes bacterium]NIN89461.1 ABC transporter permease [Candidatus Aminicenantes bacterium]
MKLLSVIKKSFKEQIRHFWIFILTVSLAPFFVSIYYVFTESAKPRYDLLIVNQDKGIEYLSEKLNYSDRLLEGVRNYLKDTPGVPLTIRMTDNKSEAIEKLKNKKADTLVVIPGDFSLCFHTWLNVDTKDDKSIQIEFIGDLTDIKYMVSAVWAKEIVNEYVFAATQKTRPLKIIETSLGVSGKIEEFDLLVPGLLILSIIMLMFSASIAVVNEAENNTIIRLKLSKVSAFEFLSGVSLIQVMIGIIAVLLTLAVAVWLGFEFAGSLWILIFLVVLTSISIIAFSLIVAAVTKTANEVLIIGNFPLLLFMFFTGAAFPMKGKVLFTIAGYPFTLQGFMSPTHSVSALKKVMIMKMGFGDILPEIIALIIMTIIYFIIGVWAFQRRHMKVE